MATEAPTIQIKIPPTGQDETAHTVVGDYIVFVTIQHDSDCQNPLTSSEGVGHIWSRNDRHNNYKPDEEIEELLAANPDSVRLSYHEHGLCRWFVAGQGISPPDMQWDGRRFAGIWVPDKCVTESYMGQDGLTREQWMAQQAESACEVYSEWCNGSCYGYIVKAYEAKYEDGDLFDDRDDYRKSGEIMKDSCWGHVGDESVLEAAADAAKAALKAIERHDAAKAALKAIERHASTKPKKRDKPPSFHLNQARTLLDTMDDDLTARGAEGDEGGRKELARVRRLKTHINRALKGVE